MNQFVDRMIRAAKLDAALYEEVEADRGALGQAMAVVVLSSVAGGLAAGARAGTSWLVFGAFLALGSWFIWAGITCFVGTRLLPETQTRADYGELLRALGFSSAPGIVRLAGLVPGLGAISGIVASVWMLAAMVVAVRQALDYTSTGRAVAVCAIGWAVQLFLVLVVFGMFVGLARG